MMESGHSCDVLSERNSLANDALNCEVNVDPYRQQLTHRYDFFLDRTTLMVDHVYSNLCSVYK